jgi:hypothetical protein
MSERDRPEQAVESGGVADARPACVALVPVVQRTEWSAHGQPLRPASTFIAQLLATSEQALQARGTTLADAQTAYNVSRHQARAAVIRTRQII